MKNQLANLHKTGAKMATDKAYDAAMLALIAIPDPVTSTIGVVGLGAKKLSSLWSIVESSMKSTK